MSAGTAAPRIGVFGGTFDPPHAAHLALAAAALDRLQLDRLLFVVSGSPWQKHGVSPAPDRLKMMELALAQAPAALRERAEVERCELDRAGPSYTADTLALLRRRYGPDAVLMLLIGSDQFRNLPSWHRYDELPALAHIAVADRAGMPADHLPPRTLPAGVAGGTVSFEMPAIDLSATALRTALAAGDRHSIAAMIAPDVLDYIDAHRLYRLPKLAE
ncbi:nicotinate (nicotinamide) nucleotide adenylyltransferase [Derxia lacustris]|uniref:nicotinate (nicotinamide) nucleotide adenylyltransferase n=1 Tax=Derxia lacustris TaxID=764842 RepID=UPI000A16E2AB|nr:nicotinate (nicotinamide) nucleotide adenylyltransferase [Derxia lacustris]